MATTPFNITIKQKDGNDWKILYPKTLIGQVVGLEEELDSKEEKANKVNSVSGSSTETEYTSAKAVYDITRTYVHEQGEASETWTITHNLDKYPSVTVVDTANSVVIGEVQYTSKNALVVRFSGAFKGTAYLN